MKKKNNIIIIILLLIIVGLIIYLNYRNKEYKNKTIEYSCSFTKTYMVSNLWTIDTKEDTPGLSYVILKQFQSDDMITTIIPTELRDKLQEGKYYEFTYTIKGKDKLIKTMEDINTYFLSNNSDETFKITVDAKETDKQGLEQIQESICLPK